MAGALLYKPRQRWRVGAAFGAAALIHLAVVAFAGIQRNMPMAQVSPGWGEFPIDAFIDPAPPIDEPTPPSEIVEPPTPHPPDEWFFDEKRIAPPVRRLYDKRVAPILRVKRPGAGGSLNLSAAKILALHAPRPEYPYEARRYKITGAGVIEMAVDPANGRVTDVSVWQSTGSLVLDNAALTGFRKWRFQPGTVSRVKCPITFMMIGAQY